MMNKIIIDCDPGVDDSFAILMAARDKDTEIIGLTSTFGNTNLDNATENLLGLKKLFNIDAPVYIGSENPIMFLKKDYGEFHGSNGLGGVHLDTSGVELAKGYAWDGIYDLCKKYPNEVTVITLGPVTNLAKALLKYEDLAGLIKEIHMMGGTANTGNEGIYGEVNFMNDPHAAKIAFKADVKKTMSGLDGNYTTMLNKEEIEKVLEKVKKNIPELFTPLDFYNNSQVKAGAKGLVINDAAAMQVALTSDYEFENLPVDVEIVDGISFGRSVIDRRPYSPFKKNAYIVTSIDKQKFVDKLLASIVV